jgi:transcriptional regulator with XRE-family HTH domain
LGNRAEVDRANVSRIEGGKKNFTLEVLWRFANIIEVHWADLLDDCTTDLPEAPYTSIPFEQQLWAFGTRAYQARALQHLSQQDLASRTGIGRSTISWIEDGTRNVKLESLSRLAAALRVHWADLLDDRQDHPPQTQPARPAGSDRCVTDTADDGQQQREVGFRDVAKEIGNAFDRHDQPRLAELNTGQLEAHLNARRLLYDYVDRIWHDTQRHGLNPHPERDSVAALRDLTRRLTATALNERMRKHR